MHRRAVEDIPHRHVSDRRIGDKDRQSVHAAVVAAQFKMMFSAGTTKSMIPTPSSFTSNVPTSTGSENSVPTNLLNFFTCPTAPRIATKPGHRCALDCTTT
ncbi:hypothetical protein [Rhodococcus sp. C3V]|uniref:hypothetical protein n=1 Tax=Rhodococcus sp. C3V TaxID=3034165 RepID=UPI0023E1411E|nr:hypothetical protein [Rhodococcus sp. C3V]MDF3320056.1 hypothetical protein [Rhodococcus sp. C3V]